MESMTAAPLIAASPAQPICGGSVRRVRNGPAEPASSRTTAAGPAQRGP
ncbi:hypothetical protein [Pseudonocardia sp. HH130630-07]|nr:hypothetical protein [Pseudonocardia sp. HH130630-07]